MFNKIFTESSYQLNKNPGFQYICAHANTKRANARQTYQRKSKTHLEQIRQFFFSKSKCRRFLPAIKKDFLLGEICFLYLAEADYFDYMSRDDKRRGRRKPNKCSLKMDSNGLCKPQTTDTSR